MLDMEISLFRTVEDGLHNSLKIRQHHRHDVYSLRTQLLDSLYGTSPDLTIIFDHKRITRLALCAIASNTDIYSGLESFQNK